MVQTVGLVVVLIVAALVLLVLEILTPSFGLLGGLALATLAAAVYFAFTLSAVFGFVVLAGSIVGVPIYLVGLVRWAPRAPFARRFFLRQAEDGSGQGTPEASELKALIGREGTAATPLRPAGAIRIDGRRVDAVAESGLIEAGAGVRVVRARGTDVVVRAVPPRNPSEPKA